MDSVEKVIQKLKEKARPDQLEGMSGFGMTTDNRLGVSVPDMRKIAKDTGKNHELALMLYDTGIAEAKMMASMIDIPDQVTEDQMEKWVVQFDSWDVCDQVCMNLFDKVSFVENKIREWSKREEEYVKRAAFALIACVAWHKKEETDDYFIQFLSVIKEGSIDNRNYVKKAVSWALRHIGKRNLNLNKIAIKTAEEIKKIDNKAARWIGSDVIRELTSEAVKKRLKK